MLVPIAKFRDEYDAAVEENRKAGSPTILFVAPDTDSLCACKILTNLLQLDNVPYIIKPVNGYSDVSVAAEELIFSNPDTRAVWFINCGGTIDIYKHLLQDRTEAESELLEKKVKLLIVDSHQPTHLWNLASEATNVLVFQGNPEFQTDKLPDPLEEEEDEESYSSSDNEMSDSESTNNYRPRRRRPRGGAQNQEARERRREIRQYYRYGSFGPAAAHVMYTLASQCSGGGERNDFLWWAIIGLTDQFVHERIEPSMYNNHVRLYNDSVQRNNVEDAEDDNLAVRDAQTGSTVMVKSAHAHRIQYESGELRFMLHRQWNLYDAMLHTDYVTAKLRTWTAAGRQELERFLAKMGIPLTESRQNYESMSHAHKSKLKEMVRSYAPQFGLDEITYESFTQSHGFTQVHSASDMVYSVSALMEAPETEGWEKNFYRAYDALSPEGHKDLMEGFRLAKLLQEHVVRQGSQLFEKQAIRSSGPFRFTYVTEAAESKLFTNPVALLRLALFIVQVLRESQYAPKPLVVAAKDYTSQTYLVVGVNQPLEFGHVEQNTFATEFKASVARARARVRHDGFDASVIEVQEDDIDAFLENLHARA